MRIWHFGLAAVSVVAAVVVVSCDAASGGKGGAASAPKVNFEDRVQATSYMLGRDIGATLKGLETEVNVDIVVAAIRETMRGDSAQVSDSVLRELDQQFRRHLAEEREAKRLAVADSNKKAGEDFLAANKSAPNVQVTESGLQYIVLTEGTGETPVAEDQVRVHYRGTLIDGTQFDSSYDRNEPTTFPLNRVIRGWTEGLQLMKVGGKMRLFVPSDLAYGERGSRPPIGPNMTLIFEIELLEIVRPEPVTPAKK